MKGKVKEKINIKRRKKKLANYLLDQPLQNLLVTENPQRLRMAKRKIQRAQQRIQKM